MYDIIYTWNLKIAQMNLSINRNRLTDMENRLWLPRGRGREWDGLGI